MYVYFNMALSESERKRESRRNCGCMLQLPGNDRTRRGELLRYIIRAREVPHCIVTSKATTATHSFMFSEPTCDSKLTRTLRRSTIRSLSTKCARLHIHICVSWS